MTKISAILLLIATVVGFVAGQRCKIPVPFSTKLIGMAFSKRDDCYRPSASSDVRIFSKVFVYRPLFSTRFFTSACEERYVFRFTRDGDPFVVRFPSVVHPDGLDVSAEEFDEFCETEQRKARMKFFPVGETREMFKEAVRKIVKGLLEIRDFGCKENKDGLIIQVPGRAFVNADLDGVISYLLGVAYQYRFCAESR